MSVYSSFEDALYTATKLMFPTTSVLFSYDNGPEEVTPYITIQVLQLDQIGREEVSGLTNSTREVTVKKVYEGFTSFKFIGDETKHSTAGDLALDFDFNLETPVVQEALLQNNLAFMRKSRIRRIPVQRDTVWYMMYQLDVYFAFSVAARQTSDTIETVKLVEEFTNDADITVVTVNPTIN